MEQQSQTKETQEREQDRKYIRLLHFNDVYELDEYLPKFIHGLNTYRQNSPFGTPLTVFSGDIFSPSQISNQMLGQNMVMPLKLAKVDVATFGNHDFDHGLKQLKVLKDQTDFPWVISNLEDKETKEPIGEGIPSYTTIHNGIQIGFIGLAEEDWLHILHIPQHKIQYIDYIDIARQQVEILRQEGCQVVIAVTHMRNHNDCRLAYSVQGIDLVLGGHDHVVFREGKVIKSGSNFQHFGVVDLEVKQNSVEIINTQTIEVMGLEGECEHTRQYVQQINDQFLKHQLVPIAYLASDLDTRFQTVRANESTLGNFLADLCRIKLKCEIGLLNGGCLRTDSIINKGFITEHLVNRMLAIQDYLVSMQLTGEQVYQALENSVSMYPALDGRWPLLSNITFTFDPLLPPGQRILINTLKFNGQSMCYQQVYSVMLKCFQSQGHDGYHVLKQGKYIISPQAELAMEKVPLEFFSKYIYQIFINKIDKVKPHSQQKKHQNKHNNEQKVNEKQLFMKLHQVTTEYFQVDGQQKLLYSINPQLDQRITIL